MTEDSCWTRRARSRDRNSSMSCILARGTTVVEELRVHRSDFPTAVHTDLDRSSDFDGTAVPSNIDWMTEVDDPCLAFYLLGWLF